MTSTLNGEARTAAKAGTAAEHIAAAEDALRIASSCEDAQAMFYVAAAQVHATLAVALADQRIADDEDRIASCVPDGSESLSVSVRGR